MPQNFRLSPGFTQEAKACRPDHHHILMSDIFFPMPQKWGLRGDSYLWTALASSFSAEIEDMDFARAFRQAFTHLTEQDFDSAPEEFYVARFAHGGMSSGGISMAWWRETGQPLLSRRLDELKAALAENVAEPVPAPKVQDISDAFFPLPKQWGLRGDPYLWGALAIHLSMADQDMDFETVFRAAFAQLTGQAFDTAPEQFSVERFAHGGMSSGGISMPWWRKTGLPLLRQRLAGGSDLPPMSVDGQDDVASEAQIPAIFYFTFEIDAEASAEDAPEGFDDAEGETTGLECYAFTGQVPASFAAAIQADIDSMADWYADIHDELEGEYGVHDWGNAPSKGLLCFGGYHSYEVAPERIASLMEAWREGLSQNTSFGLRFGPVVQIKAGEDLSDEEIHAAALAAGLHIT